MDNMYFLGFLILWFILSMINHGQIKYLKSCREKQQVQIEFLTDKWSKDYECLSQIIDRLENLENKESTE